MEFLVPRRGSSQGVVRLGFEVSEQGKETVPIAVGELSLPAMLDDFTGGSRQRSNGELVHRLSRMGPSQLDGFLSRRQKPKI